MFFFYLSFLMISNYQPFSGAALQAALQNKADSFMNYPYTVEPNRNFCGLPDIQYQRHQATPGALNLRQSLLKNYWRMDLYFSNGNSGL